MKDFLIALALVLVIEGIVCAAFPSHLRNAMRLATELGDSMMRKVGLACATIGVILVGVFRHWF